MAGEAGEERMLVEASIALDDDEDDDDKDKADRVMSESIP